MATFIINIYYNTARLFVISGKEITSQEGTTQDYPIAKAVYALALGPLLTTLVLEQQKQIRVGEHRVKQIAYADDLAAGGKLENIKIWWDLLTNLDQKIGYFPKSSKSWLIVKENMMEKTKQLFKNSGIKITSSGKRYFGAVLCSTDFRRSFVSNIVENWTKEIKLLSDIAKSDSTFVHGIKHKFNYIMRTISDIKCYLVPLEETIRNSFIKSVLNVYECNY